MNPITDILDKYPLMILDGAFSTELERKGCDLNDPLWSAKIIGGCCRTTPEDIEEISRWRE